VPQGTANLGRGKERVYVNTTTGNLVADQMPGSGVHEVLPDDHRNNPALHRNPFNQGVTDDMREADRQLHWWYRAREQGADELLPDWIYD
jgi:hypothetical protein